MSAQTPTADDFGPLLNAACDGSLTEAQLRELAALLDSDPTARKTFIRHVQLLTDIRFLCRVERASDGTLAQVRATLPPESPPFALLGGTNQGTVGYAFQTWSLAYLAAAVLLGIGLFIGSLVHIPRPEHMAGTFPLPAPSVANRPMEFVGRITGMVDCRWAEPRIGVADRESVPLGRRYALDSGFIEITYDSGAKVILQGPARYEVTSASGGYLAFGKLCARVEKQGEGRGERGEGKANPKSQIPNQHISSPLSPLPSPLFSVRTPTAVVTDLGTEFGVEVDDQGRTESHVFVGAVKVQYVGGNPGGAEGTATLRAGQSARASGGKGIVVSRTPGAGDRFVRRLRPNPANPGDATRIVERFAGAGLGPAFEQMPADSFANMGGAAVFRQPLGPSLADNGRQWRGYIRTVATDFCHRDFTFEATFDVFLQPADPRRLPHRIYFGIGDGMPNRAYCDEVTCGLVLVFIVDDGRTFVQLCRPSADVARSMAGERDADNPTVAELCPSGGLEQGRHRFRMIKSGKGVRFAVDSIVEGQFHEVFASRPIDLRTTAPLLSTADSRLLVGTGNCDTMTVRFEQLMITYPTTVGNQSEKPR